MVSNCAKCLAFTWSRLKYEERVLLTEETSSEHTIYTEFTLELGLFHTLSLTSLRMFYFK